MYGMIDFLSLFSTSVGGGYKPTDCESQSGSSCTVGSLTPATTYYFKVKAHTTGGTGPFSIFAAATTNMTSKLREAL